MDKRFLRKGNRVLILAGEKKIDEMLVYLFYGKLKKLVCDKNRP